MNGQSGLRPETRNCFSTGVITWDLFVGHQTMEMYGKFEGFPLNGALFGLENIMPPV